MPLRTGTELDDHHLMLLEMIGVVGKLIGAERFADASVQSLLMADLWVSHQRAEQDQFSLLTPSEQSAHRSSHAAITKSANRILTSATQSEQIREIKQFIQMVRFHHSSESERLLAERIRAANFSVGRGPKDL